MNIKIIRAALLIAIAFIAFNLWSKWQIEHPSSNTQTPVSANSNHVSDQNSTVPSFSTTPASNVKASSASPTSSPATSQKSESIVTVKTKTTEVAINLKGGNIVGTHLLDYPKSLKDKTPLALLTSDNSRYYVTQSGVTGIKQPNQLVFHSAKRHYQAQEGRPLVVTLEAQAQGLKIIKHYTFKPDSYEIHLQTEVVNEGTKAWQGAFFGQLLRKEPQTSEGLLHSYATYTGAALSYPGDHYDKESFSDMRSGPVHQAASQGWAAMVQHYFISAWVPKLNKPFTLYTQAYPNGVYGSGFISSDVTLKPKQAKTFNASLYIGPAIAQKLDAVAPHLSLTIDYGWLWFISQPIFSVMKWFFQLFGNWGLAIILATLLIKLIFYPLSGRGYRSMAKMRELQPKLKQLKERFGDDKQQMSKATMELYRKEKVSPLGGCLPMVIQIPIFIALYWVIMESVEFRQAPFIFWIHDLSVKDPFYVLPVLMGLSMFLQQRLNPSPPDPTMAKVTMFMPVVFTIMFAQFPSGLVLYWLSNNCFSILQQWWVIRSYSKKKGSASSSKPKKTKSTSKK